MNQNKFVEELNLLGINVTKDKLDKLEKYYNLLIEYNKVMNLTGITDHDEVYLKHFYDSLTLAKVVDLNNYKTLCDIGTGAGFPGIVLKIFYPNLKITLIDSLNKRIVFLNKVIEELGLEGIIAIHSRIEEYGIKNRDLFDIVTARAVAPLNILLEYSIPILKVNGLFLPMKANLDNEKYDNALKKLNCTLEKTEQFLLPIENSNRSILLIKKQNETNLKYPRRFNLIKTNPL